MSGEKSVVSKYLGYGIYRRGYEKNPEKSNYIHLPKKNVKYLIIPVEKTADESTSKIQITPIIFNVW